MISFYYYFTCKKSNMESRTLFKPTDHLTVMSMLGLLASSPWGKLQRAERVEQFQMKLLWQLSGSSLGNMTELGA